MLKHSLPTSGLRGKVDPLWLFLDYVKNYDLTGTRKLLWSHCLSLWHRIWTSVWDYGLTWQYFLMFILLIIKLVTNVSDCRLSAENQCNSASLVFHVFIDTLNQYLIICQSISLPFEIRIDPISTYYHATHKDHSAQYILKYNCSLNFYLYIQ